MMKKCSVILLTVMKKISIFFAIVGISQCSCVWGHEVYIDNESINMLRQRKNRRIYEKI